MKGKHLKPLVLDSPRRPSLVLWALEGARAEWLHDLRHPIVDRRYEVSQRLMGGESLQRLRTMSRSELDAYLEASEQDTERPDERQRADRAEAELRRRDKKPSCRTEYD